jgi:hypothetical protein
MIDCEFWSSIIIRVGKVKRLGLAIKDRAELKFSGYLKTLGVSMIVDQVKNSRYLGGDAIRVNQFMPIWIRGAMMHLEFKTIYYEID